MSGKRKYVFKTRQPGRLLPTSMLQQRRNQMLEELDNFVPSECCTTFECYKTVPLGHLRERRKAMLKSNQSEKKELLRSEYLHVTHDCDSDDCEAAVGDGQCSGSQNSIKERNVWVVCSARVCTKFMTQALTASKVLLDSVKGTPKALAPQSSRRAPRFSARMSKADFTVVVLDRLAAYSDRMPDAEEIRLPMTTRAQVFDYYVRECQSRGESSSSLSHFLRTWNERRATFKCRRLTRFAKCDSCEYLQSKLGRLSLQQERARSETTQQLHAHWDFIRAERQVYYDIRDRSRMSPASHLSMIIDGADQTAYSLPHFAQTTKRTSAADKIQMKLLGSLVHGHSNKFFCALISKEQPCGGNSVIEMIHQSLTFLKPQMSGKLPPNLHLHLQLDNCTGQNKNRYVMGYCKMLIIFGVFEKVDVYFLPVGHTHEDIDQAFSRSSIRLKTHDAVTLKDLSEQVRLSYTPEPHVFLLENQANVSALFDLILNQTPIPTFTTYRLFRFVRGGPLRHRDSPPLNFYPAKCLVKLSGSEGELQEFLPRDSQDGVFLKSAPDLRMVPPLHIHPPGDESYRQSQESGIEACREAIADEGKSTMLRELLDKIHWNRVMEFPWDLGTCVEMNGDYISQPPHDDDQQEEEIQTPEAVPDSTLQYRVGEMFAAFASLQGTDTFWIGRIERVERDDGGNALRLNVVWYDVAVGQEGREEELLKARYVEATVRRNGRDVPYYASVSLETVLCTFPDLLRSGRVPVAVQKEISTALRNAIAVSG